MEKEKIVLKVAGKCAVPKLAGSIVLSIEDDKEVELHAIGASAISQAVKALTSAWGILASKGYDLSFVTGFGSTEINGSEKTLIKFKVKCN